MKTQFNNLISRETATTMTNQKINFTAKVKEYAHKLTDGRYKGMYAIDVTCSGIAPYMDDCENGTMYRGSIFEIASEMFDFNTDDARDHARLQDALADEATLMGR